MTFARGQRSRSSKRSWVRLMAWLGAYLAAGVALTIVVTAALALRTWPSSPAVIRYDPVIGETWVRIDTRGSSRCAVLPASFLDFGFEKTLGAKPRWAKRLVSGEPIETTVYGWPLRWWRYTNDLTVATNTMGFVRLGTRQLISPWWPGLAVNVLLFIAVVAASHAALASIRRVIRRRNTGVCRQCGYDRRGLPAGGVCPECGTVDPPKPLRGHAAGR